jgi:hypothetical protein
MKPITWEKGELIENHGSGCKEYAMNGVDKDGIEYIATGVYQDGVFEEIIDIELA